MRKISEFSIVFVFGKQPFVVVFVAPARFTKAIDLTGACTPIERRLRGTFRFVTRLKLGFPFLKGLQCLESVHGFASCSVVHGFFKLVFGFVFHRRFL